jgi:hypothetical protein
MFFRRPKPENDPDRIKNIDLGEFRDYFAAANWKFNNKEYDRVFHLMWNTRSDNPIYLSNCGMGGRIARPGQRFSDARPLTLLAALSTRARFHSKRQAAPPWHAVPFSTSCCYKAYVPQPEYGDTRSSTLMLTRCLPSFATLGYVGADW